MIVLFGGEKGGTGKSTIATNIAVFLARKGRDVLLVDTDQQRSSAAWAATRAGNSDLPAVQCVEKSGDVLRAVRDLAGRYQHVIIDAGGRDSKEMRSGMLASEKMYIPIKASQFDLWTVDRMNTLVDQSHGFNPDLKVFALISMAPTNPIIHEAKEAQEMIADFKELVLAETIVRERKVYRDAIVEGKGVLELANSKAHEEIESLAQEIFNGKI